MHKASAPFAITKDNILTSANGQYTCRLNEDGKAIVRREADGAAVWQSDGSGVVLRLQEDGNLVLYRADDSVAWKTNTDGRSRNPLLRLSDNGRLILIEDGIEGFGDLTELDVVFALWASPAVLTEDQIKALALKVSQEGVLVVGHKLNKGQTMRSKNGKFTLELTDSGMVIKNASGEPVWQPELQSEGIPDHLAMQTDKNLVLYTADGKPLWSANISCAGLDSDLRCVLGDDGELAVYQSNNTEWSAGSAPGADRLNSGACLTKDRTIRSANGQYTLNLRQDGNLVLTDAAGKALWMTGLIASEAERLVMQRDGNLVLAGANGAVIWASHTHNGTLGARHGKTLIVRDDGTLNVSGRSGGTSWSSGIWSADRLNPGQGLAPGMELKSPAGARLAVQEDGNMVLYCRHNQVRWSSGTQGKNLRGLCNRSDGRLALYGKDGGELWAAGMAGRGRHDISLQLQDRPHSIALLFGDDVIVQDYRLMAGEHLRTGECLPSPNRNYELTIDNTGQLVVRRTKDQRVRYANGVKASVSASLSVLADGNAVIYAKDGQTVLWESKTGGKEGNYELAVTNEGFLQLRRIDPNPAIIWDVRRCRLFEGELFGVGEVLVSPNGAYSLALQADGRLELARNADKAILWSSFAPGKSGNTFGHRYEFGMMNDGALIVQDDNVRDGDDSDEGLLYVGLPNTFSGSGGHYDLVLTDEGRLIVTRTSDPNHPLWQAP